MPGHYPSSWTRTRRAYLAAVLVETGELRCAVCNVQCTTTDPRSPHHATVDHKTERVNGGTDAWSNLRVACARCNSRLGQQTATLRRHRTTSATSLGLGASRSW